MVPEFHPAASDVDVCATESVFIQVTVAPAATSSSSGWNARSPSDCALEGIATDDDEPVTTGVGDVTGDDPTESDELLPQAQAHRASNDMMTRRSENICTSRRS
jgi:hypothetical protein